MIKFPINAKDFQVNNQVSEDEEFTVTYGERVKHITDACSSNFGAGIFIGVAIAWFIVGMIISPIFWVGTAGAVIPGTFLWVRSIKNVDIAIGGIRK